MKNKSESFLTAVLLLAAICLVVFSIKLPVERIILRADYSKAPKKYSHNEVQEKLITVLRARMNAIGVSKSVIQPKGADQIIVELPSSKNDAAALKMLQSNAQLEFRYFRDVSGKSKTRYDMLIKDGEYHFYDNLNNKQELTNSEVKEKIINASPLILTGNDLTATSRVSYSSMNNQPVVDLEMTPEGTRKFADFTQSHIEEHLAIILNGEILSVPVINDAITDGHAEISGNMNMEEAKELAGLLNTGYLPVPLSVIRVEKVSKPWIITRFNTK